MAQRRHNSSTPGGTRRPGQRGSTSRARAAATTTPDPTPQPPPKRPRLTGRAGVLVLVLAVLAVSYASSLKAYLEQRAHINDLQASIAQREESIAALEREKRRWDDPAYVKAQARSRFGYLMPGQTGFQVLDAEGNPLDGRGELADPEEAAGAPAPWWSDAWQSMELAGNPPVEQKPPAELIDGVKKSKRDQQ